MKRIIETSVTKLEFLAGILANTPVDTIRIEGLYTIMSQVIDEIKTALDEVEDRPAFTAANQAA